jgi:hypothetical protein
LTQAECPSTDRQSEAQAIFEHAETYVKAYSDVECETIHPHCRSKQCGDFHIPAEPNLTFVVGIKGITTRLTEEEEDLGSYCASSRSTAAFPSEQGSHQYATHFRLLRRLSYPIHKFIYKCGGSTM